MLKKGRKRSQPSKEIWKKQLINLLMDINSKVLRRLKCSTNLKISFKVIGEGKGRLVGGNTTIFVLVNQKRKSFTIQINVEKNFTELERYINNMIKSFYFQPTVLLLMEHLCSS